MKKQIISIIGASFFALGITSMAVATPLVYTSDFISYDQLTNFNGFENLPAPGEGAVLSNGVLMFNDPSEAFYEEDGVHVDQVFTTFIPGNENFGIWTSHFPADGNRDWYPNGGDDGYTRITRSTGENFNDVGFYLSSGVSANYYLYILLNDGNVVLDGAVAKPNGLSYLGFSGDNFDEILVRSIWASGSNYDFFDASANGLGIDSIELSGATPVPEPSSVLLFCTGLTTFAARKIRRKVHTTFAA